VKTFHYHATDALGENVRGTVSAPDWNAARDLLEARGLRGSSPVPVEHAGHATAADTPPRRLTPDEAIDLASCLSALARAELPMAAGIRAVARDMRDGNLPGAMHALASRLESGEGLESAVDSLGTGLAPHVRALMIVGARTGRLAETLDELLEHKRTMTDMRRRFWQIMAYPVTLMAFLVLWLLFVSLWLVPQMEMSSILADIDEMNSWSRSKITTSGYAGRMSEFARGVPWLLVLLAVGMALLLIAAHALGGRAMVSRLWMRVPLVGTARLYRSLVEYCNLLGLFLGQQLRLDESLRLTSQAAHDAAIRAAAAGSVKAIEAGRSLSWALAESPPFPPTLVSLVEWAERHAALADTLRSAARMYRDRFELQLRLIRLIVPPIVFLFVAGTALFVSYGWFIGSISAIRLLSY
jgi:type II secretory pathway component PulF